MHEYSLALEWDAFFAVMQNHQSAPLKLTPHWAGSCGSYSTSARKDRHEQEILSWVKILHKAVIVRRYLGASLSVNQIPIRALVTHVGRDMCISGIQYIEMIGGG